MPSHEVFDFAGLIAKLRSAKELCHRTSANSSEPRDTNPYYDDAFSELADALGALEGYFESHVRVLEYLQAYVRVQSTMVWCLHCNYE